MRKGVYLLIATLLILSACQSIQHQMNGHHGGMQGHHFKGQKEDAGRASRDPGRMHHFNQALQASTGENEVAIPPLLEPDRIDGQDIYYTIEATEGEREFSPGKKTKTRGYNSLFLGPVVKVKKDQ